MKLDVYEIKEDPKKPIAIQLRGEDFTFVASSSSVFFTLDADMADKLAFQIGSLLQDRERKNQK